MKIALIFGITGQDGSYLAEFLLKKKYKVHGVKRKSSSFNTDRVDHIYEKNNKNFFLHYGDLTDALSVNSLINLIKPDEIYNLAAQSHVAVSFAIPSYTANVDALGCLNILEAIKSSAMQKKIKFYQAGTSEMFGKVLEVPQTEKTPFYPRSPYGVSKVFSYWMTKNYRESYNMFACNGILFNHESPRRGETFVTRKITIGLSRIKLGLQRKLILGNIYSKRDWGHAKDYVEAQWLILQNKKPDDFVIATGKQYSVKYFVNLVARELKMKIVWKGKGINEKAYDHNNKVIIECSKKYFRPSEVDTLLGNSNKAKKVLSWKPKISIKKLVKEMVKNDYDKFLNDKKK
ncbi:GDP-mannose 4,6-dehydratase [Candidatus Pelagibacter sp.]|uniref:GDP-mannose 4,6-dehydratase n=1 Tax=Candidatus Pelagibacter sp. TaxID=2024849 RepID=UPI003F880214